MIATLLTVALAIILGLWWASTRSTRAEIGADPTPTPAPSSSSAASSAPQAPTSTPTPSATPAPTDAPVVGDWVRAATFTGTLTQVTDIAIWDEGFVATGAHWPAGGTSGPSEPRVWTSPDGLDWAEVPIALEETGVRPTSIEQLPDGRLLMLAWVPRLTASGIGSVAWTSPDATIWAPIDLPFLGARAAHVTSGPSGYVATTAHAIWQSADGLSWQRVHEAPNNVFLDPAVAGDEGYVVSTGGSVVASADGVNWFQSDAAVTAIAPLGGDWLGSTNRDDLTSTDLVRSANGLDWSPVLDMRAIVPEDTPLGRPPDAPGPIGSVRVAAGGLVVTTIAWNHCCAALDFGALALGSSDGSTWRELDLGAEPFVATAVATDDLIVLGGYSSGGAEGAIWVRQR